jgi:hypothetical protein
MEDINVVILDSIIRVGYNSVKYECYVTIM